MKVHARMWVVGHHSTEDDSSPYYSISGEREERFRKMFDISTYHGFTDEDLKVMDKQKVLEILKRHGPTLSRRDSASLSDFVYTILALERGIENIAKQVEMGLKAPLNPVTTADALVSIKETIDKGI